MERRLSITRRAILTRLAHQSAAQVQAALGRDGQAWQAARVAAAPQAWLN